MTTPTPPFDFLPSIQVTPQTYDTIMYWRTTVIALLVIFIVFGFIFPIGNLFRKYIAYPALAFYLKGVWAKDDRFCGHEKMMRELFLQKQQNGAEDEECPELIPAEPVLRRTLPNPQNHGKKKK